MLLQRLTGLCLALVMTGSAMAEAPWSLSYDKDGIRVYTRAVEGSQFAAFRAETWLPARLDAVLAVAADPTACSEWIYQCESAEILDSTGFHQRNTWQINDMPWPVADRDIVLDVRIEEEYPGGPVRVRMINRPDYLEDRGYVRVQQSEGEYVLIPERGGVRIVWEQHTDPGGILPGWLVNQLIENLPVQTLQGMARLVQQAPYAQARLARDAQGAIAGWVNSDWLALKR